MPHYLQNEQEGQIYTDEQAGTPTTQEKANEKQFDPNHAPVAQAEDATPALDQRTKPRFRQVTDTKTDERENPGQAVRDSYQDA